MVGCIQVDRRNVGLSRQTAMGVRSVLKIGRSPSAGCPSASVRSTPAEIHSTGRRREE